MKKMVMVCAVFLLGITGLVADSTWRGQARIWEMSGLSVDSVFAATNEFPRNTLLNIENPATHKTLQVRVIQRAPEVTDGNFVFLSPGAGKELGMKIGESVLVVVQVDTSLAGFRASLIEDRVLTQDPERNPAAVTSATATTVTVEVPVPTVAQNTPPVIENPVQPPLISPSINTEVNLNNTVVEAAIPTFVSPPETPLISPQTPSVTLSSPVVPLLPTLGSLSTSDLPAVDTTVPENIFLQDHIPSVVSPGTSRPTDGTFSPLVLTPSLPDGVGSVFVAVEPTGEKPEFSTSPALPGVGAPLVAVQPSLPEAIEQPGISPSATPPVAPGNVVVLTPSVPNPEERPGISPSITQPLVSSDALAVAPLLPQLPEAVELPRTVATPTVGPGTAVTVVTPTFSEPTKVEPILVSPSTTTVVTQTLTLPQALPTTPQGTTPVVTSPEILKPQVNPHTPQVVVTPTTPVKPPVTPPVTLPVKPPVGTQSADSVTIVAPQSLGTQPYANRPVSPVGGVLGDLKVITSLSSGGDYIQLASFTEEKSLMSAIEKIKSHVPLTIWAPQTDRPVFRLVAGPLGRDQTGVLVYHFRNQGYKDAFVIKDK